MIDERKDQDVTEAADLEEESRSSRASGGYLPEHIAQLRELLARLRASDRSAIILVDGKRGTIQIWNAVPAGVMKMR